MKNSDHINELLHTLYYNEITGYQGIEKLYKKAHLLDKNIKLKHVSEFLQSQPSYQLTKPIKKTKIKYSSIISPGVRNNYQMDIMYLPDTTSTMGFKYLLTCMDVYSRYAFVQLLKTKTGQEVYDKIRFMFQLNGIPKNINVDKGSEFIDNKFIKYCDDNDIKVWFSSPNQDNKNAIIERFHRTLRNLILKYKMASNKPYIKILPQLIENYNTSFHKTVQNYPSKIWLGKGKNKQLIKHVKYNFMIGDKVRTINPRNTFDKKSSTNTYTKKIYTITNIEGNSYYLDELDKPFRGHELILANGGDLTSDFDHELEHDQKLRKNEKILRRESIDIENILSSKRERKPKEFFV
jgi:transposase InsO family protein